MLFFRKCTFFPVSSCHKMAFTRLCRALVLWCFLTENWLLSPKNHMWRDLLQRCGMIQKMWQNHLKIQLFHLKNGCMLQLLQQQPKKKTCSILHDFLESNPTSAHSPQKKALPHYRWLVWHSAYQWRPGSKDTVDFSSSSVASNLVTSPDVWCRSFSEWFDFLKSGNLKFW